MQSISIDHLLDRAKDAIEMWKRLLQVWFIHTSIHIIVCVNLEPVPVRYLDIYKREKARSEMGRMFRSKTVYPIAPDGKKDQRETSARTLDVPS